MKVQIYKVNKKIIILYKVDIIVYPNHRSIKL